MILEGCQGKNWPILRHRVPNLKGSQIVREGYEGKNMPILGHHARDLERSKVEGVRRFLYQLAYSSNSLITCAASGCSQWPLLHGDYQNSGGASR